MQTCAFLRKRLYKSFGETEVKLHKHDVEDIAINIYILIINLFKKGSPFTLLGAYKFIKQEILEDNEMMDLFKEHDSRNDKRVVKICNILVSIHNSLLIAIIFKVMFFLKYQVINRSFHK